MNRYIDQDTVIWGRFFCDLKFSLSDVDCEKFKSTVEKLSGNGDAPSKIFHLLAFFDEQENREGFFKSVFNPSPETNISKKYKNQIIKLLCYMVGVDIKVDEICEAFRVVNNEEEYRNTYSTQNKIKNRIGKITRTNLIAKSHEKIATYYICLATLGKNKKINNELRKKLVREEPVVRASYNSRFGHAPVMRMSHIAKIFRGLFDFFVKIFRRDNDSVLFSSGNLKYNSLYSVAAEHLDHSNKDLLNKNLLLSAYYYSVSNENEKSLDKYVDYIKLHHQESSGDKFEVILDLPTGEEVRVQPFSEVLALCEYSESKKIPKDELFKSILKNSKDADAQSIYKKYFNDETESVVLQKVTYDNKENKEDTDRGQGGFIDNLGTCRQESEYLEFFGGSLGTANLKVC